MERTGIQVENEKSRPILTAKNICVLVYVLTPNNETGGSGEEPPVSSILESNSAKLRAKNSVLQSKMNNLCQISRQIFRRSFSRNSARYKTFMFLCQAPRLCQIDRLPCLSFQRCLLVTDGLFYNELDNGNLSPLWVMRHGIRGTQNINKASKEGQAASASAKRDEVSNIQTTDSAKLDANASALQVRFNLRGMDIQKALFACAPGQKDSMDDLNAFKADLAAFVDRAKESEALVHLACRYVRNIANGRFLWRNRTVASSATVEVLLPDGTKKMFDALATPFNHFEEVSDDERTVAEVLARGWKGDPTTELRVTAHVDLGVGGAVEVFPSQNYLENKARGFARPLYCVGGAPDGQDQHSVRIMGQAALRDQKIGNALRTIDTWYPAYEERRVPLPVEPNGASLDAQEFFRNKGDASGFKLMLRVSELDPMTPDGLFLLACIIRGGVFSGSE